MTEAEELRLLKQMDEIYSLLFMSNGHTALIVDIRNLKAEVAAHRKEHESAKNRFGGWGDAIVKTILTIASGGILAMIWEKLTK